MHPFSDKVLKLSKIVVKEFGANEFCERTSETIDTDSLCVEFSALSFDDKKKVVSELKKWKHGWALCEALVREDDDSLEDGQWEELDTIVQSK